MAVGRNALVDASHGMPICHAGITGYSIDGIFRCGYNMLMAWEVEYTDEFGAW